MKSLLFALSAALLLQACGDQNQRQPAGNPPGGEEEQPDPGPGTGESPDPSKFPPIPEPVWR